MQKYLVDWVKFLQPQKEAEEAREQFGWHDNDTKFLIGGREIRSDGSVAFSPPCSTTEEIVPLYMTKGDIDSWRTVVNTYGKPGNEARAFVLFAHMGTPQSMVGIPSFAAVMGPMVEPQPRSLLWI